MDGHVAYIIPSDGDVLEQPNIFPLSGPVDKITLRQVVDAFPLPGEYHFRFKSQYEKTYIWLDATAMDEVVPCRVCEHADRRSA